ncbi:MAG: M20/M25/M40 family metallo-hydrolase [Acidobacteriota bacterium]|nr:M20/M25/M40 family metallo-hydrolase [Acidobacteriota bacterium]
MRIQIGSLVLVIALVLHAAALGQSRVYSAPKEDIEKIMREGSGNSQVMKTASYLTNAIGGRLTNSPNMRRANKWTRDTLEGWGMQNARLEPWGEFGRGWSIEKFYAQISSPQAAPLIAYPKAWSPSTNGEITADVVYIDDRENLEKYRGKLEGKIVLVSGVREIKADFEPPAVRHDAESLLRLANAPDPDSLPPRESSPDGLNAFVQRYVENANFIKFLLEEKAALLVDNSRRGSGGTIFVGDAAVSQEFPDDPAKFLAKDRRLPYEKRSEAYMLPQITMATEHYNRLVRMIEFGEDVRMTVDMRTRYHDEDLLAYNTIAEIPGSDPVLKDEIVMLGAHLDSEHPSTGATDNAAGCAVVMEAARIILAAGLKPRRTIRIALWSGEEQGIKGSRAYVFKHFGIRDDINPLYFSGVTFGEFTKKADYDKLSAYYNLDNGTGKIRGVYLQSNEKVAPIFRQWLMPFAEMGASTLTLRNTRGTDHLSFDSVGLPGFQFIQDEIEYDSKTHHSNQDNFDRLQAEDLKQASIIMSAFVYQTAMMDEKIPRKPLK